MKFAQTNVTDFLVYALSEYPDIAARALSVVLPFSTTYLCNNGFSAMTAFETKYRNRLCAQNNLRLALTTLEPRIDKIMRTKH